MTGTIVRRLRDALTSIATASLLAAWPGTAAAETLAEALAAAYMSNPTLQAERARLRATDEQVPQALSGYRPTLEIEGIASRVDSKAELEGLSGVAIPGVSGTIENNFDPVSGTFTLTQPLFRGLRTLYGTRQAEQTVLSGREGLRTVENDTLLQAVTAFMDVVRDAAVVDLRVKNVEVLRRQLQASRDRFEVGEITRTDVAQSEARLSLSESNLIAARGVLATSRAAYERVIGRAPGTLEVPPDLPVLPASKDDALSTALENSPVFRSAQFAERASAEAVKVATGVLLPSLNARAEYQISQNSSASTLRSDQATISGVLSIPLYQSGAEYSRVREAKQVNSQNRLQIAEARRQVEEAVSNAWELLVTARARITADQSQVSANEIALEGVQQEAQVGSRTTLDVLDAEEELLDSRVALVGSQRDQYVAAYSVLQSIGRLGARDLDLSVAYYDPMANYEDVRGRWIGTGTIDE